MLPTPKEPSYHLECLTRHHRGCPRTPDHDIVIAPDVMNISEVISGIDRRLGNCRSSATGKHNPRKEDYAFQSHPSNSLGVTQFGWDQSSQPVIMFTPMKTISNETIRHPARETMVLIMVASLVNCYHYGVTWNLLTNSTSPSRSNQTSPRRSSRG